MIDIQQQSDSNELTTYGYIKMLGSTIELLVNELKRHKTNSQDKGTSAHSSRFNNKIECMQKSLKHLENSNQIKVTVSKTLDTLLIQAKPRAGTLGKSQNISISCMIQESNQGMGSLIDDLKSVPVQKPTNRKLFSRDKLSQSFNASDKMVLKELEQKIPVFTSQKPAITMLNSRIPKPSGLKVPSKISKQKTKTITSTNDKFLTETKISLPSSSKIISFSP
jgi:hypothetical protein